VACWRHSDPTPSHPHSDPTPSHPQEPPRHQHSTITHVIQGDYGYGDGWEDLTAATTRDEALARLREYRGNEPGIAFRWIRRRERAAPIPKKSIAPVRGRPATRVKQAHATGGNTHARKKKLDPHEAKQQLKTAGLNFSRDFHQLSSSQKDLLLDSARTTGYCKRKDAPGSTARMYFQYLARLK
jgi:hypothetical protein